MASSLPQFRVCPNQPTCFPSTYLQALILILLHGCYTLQLGVDILCETTLDHSVSSSHRLSDEGEGDGEIHL